MVSVSDEGNFFLLTLGCAIKSLVTLVHSPMIYAVTKPSEFYKVTTPKYLTMWYCLCQLDCLIPKKKVQRGGKRKQHNDKACKCKCPLPAGHVSVFPIVDELSKLQVSSYIPCHQVLLESKEFDQDGSVLINNVPWNYLMDRLPTTLEHRSVTTTQWNLYIA